MVGRPRKYPKELGKVISKSFSVPEGAVTYLEGMSEQTGRSMTELLGYSIISIEKEKVAEFFSVMQENRKLLLAQMDTLKTNNELLKGMAQRHDSVYAAFKDLEKLPENIENLLDKELESMSASGATRAQALLRIEGILDKVEAAAISEGKVPKSRQVIKAIVRTRILKKKFRKAD